ncbi:MAG: hypothetical protein ChlgKO_03220 [Chlamydiales bacterium]
MATLFCCRRQAATFAFKTLLSRHIEGASQCEVNFGEVTWEGKGFTVERFHLEKKGEYELKIRKLRFTFPGDIYLYRPKCKIVKTDGPAICLKKRRHKSSLGNLLIEKGELETPFAKARFTYADEQLLLFSDDSQVVAQFFQPQKKEYLTHLSTSGADVPWLFGLLYPFVPTYSLEIDSGKVSGEFDYRVAKNETTTRSEFTFENLSGRLGMLPGNYHFANIRGSFDQGEALCFSVEGECSYNDLHAPFCLQGQDFGGRLFANLLFDRNSLANIEVKGDDFHNCSIKVESPQILAKHLAWFGSLSPFFHEVSGGRFSGTVFTQIHESACKEINACNIRGEGFTFRDVTVDELLVTGLIATEKFSHSRLNGEFLLSEKGEGNFCYERGSYTLSVTAPPDLLVGKGEWEIPSLSIDAKGRIDGRLITAEGTALAVDESVDFSLIYEDDTLRSLDLSSDHLSDAFYRYPLSQLSKTLNLKGAVALRAKYSKGSGANFELLPIDLTYENSEYILRDNNAKVPHHFSIFEGKVKAELILTGAKLTEKELGLTFSNVTGRILLEDDAGYSSWIEGESEGCAVGGELKFTKDHFQLKGREFHGKVEGLLTFIKPFTKIDFPLSGKFYALEQGLIFTQEGNSRNVQISLGIEEGELPLSYDLAAKELKCGLHFDSKKKEFEIEDLTGKLFFFETPVYGLDGRHLALKEGKLNFDLRVSNDVREIVKLEGSGTTPFSYLIELDLEKSHLFGERFAKGNLELKPNGKIAAVHAKVPLHLESLERQVLAHLPDIKEHRIEGCVDMEFSVEESGQKAALVAFGEEVSIWEKKHQPFSTLLIKEGKEIRLDHLRFGKHELEGEGQWRADKIDIEKIVGFSPYGELSALSGHYNFAKKRGEISFSTKNSNIHKIHTAIPLLVDTQAKLHFDVDAKTIEGELQVQNAEAALAFFTEEPIQFSYKWKEGVALESIALEVDGAKIRAEKILYRKGEWHCRRAHLSLPPETFHKIPYLETLPWENHIDLSGDFSYGAAGISAQGAIKQGYYWVAGQSIHLDEGTFTMQGKKLHLDLSSHLRETPIQLIGEIYCAHNYRTSLRLKTDRKSEGVLITGDWNKGPMIERIEGEFLGQKIHFIGAGIPEEIEAIALSGNVHIDIERLLPLLPENVQTHLQKAQLSGAYELSGDLILDRTQPLDAIFQGFLKGRYFGLGGNHFKTLLSEIEITGERIFLRDLNLSDEAILMQMDQALFTKKGEDWHFTIPGIAIQDFRPSLMRKKYGNEKRMKPFTIRSLNIEKLEGNLSDKHTITGRGSLSFVNTFKRSNNLLDIPIEIISRIGLDQSILIPVMGDMDFVFENGEIHLTKLENCVSEGRHSRFTLSKNRPSYIGLDGSIHVDIKMKQHVLLRLTQPFVLSLRGTLAKPRYSLKG